MRTIGMTTALSAMVLMLVGCGASVDEAPPTGPAPAESDRPDVVPDMPGPPPPPSSETTPETPSAEPAGETTDPSSSTPAPPTDAQRAEVGVGRKGRGYGTGPIATPLAAHWSAAERMVFNIQIPQAMKLYEATHGGPPQSHEQFMEEIIKPNGIRLPELPNGRRYQYDPQRGELMVVDE